VLGFKINHVWNQKIGPFRFKEYKHCGVLWLRAWTNSLLGKADKGSEILRNMKFFVYANGHFHPAFFSEQAFIVNVTIAAVSSYSTL